MDLSIRKAVLHNLDDSNYDEIKNMIETSIQEGDEITLPGLGVLFEVLWQSTTDQQKNDIALAITNAVAKKA